MPATSSLPAISDHCYKTEMSVIPNKAEGIFLILSLTLDRVKVAAIKEQRSKDGKTLFSLVKTLKGYTSV
jgi:hypothetical protein